MRTIKKTIILVFIALFALAAAVSASLEIQNIKLSSVGVDEEVKPGESLKVSFDVKNTETEDVGDVEATLTFESGSNSLEDDDGDEIEFTIKLSTIDTGESKDASQQFVVPFNVEDGDEYDIVINVEGETKDSENTVESEDRSMSFSVVRETHELVFYTLKLNPSVIQCERAITLDVGIRNLGSDDEDDINLTAISSRFGSNISETFDLEADYYGDNTFEKSYTFTVPSSTPAGFYKMSPTLRYDDGDKVYSKEVNLTVKDCAQKPATPTTPVTPTAPTQPKPNTTSTPTTTPTTSNPPITTIGYTPVKSSFIERNLTTILIIGAAAIIVLLISILFLILSRK